MLQVLFRLRPGENTKKAGNSYEPVDLLPFGPISSLCEKIILGISSICLCLFFRMP